MTINIFAILFLTTRLAMLVAYILFLVNLQNTLKACSSKNRLIEPGKVWLNLVPVLNLIWPFVINPKISKSVKQEMEQRQGASDYDNYGLNLGLIYPALMVINFAAYWVRLGAVISWILALASLISLIVYWVRMSDYKKQLQGMVNVTNENELLDSM